MSESRSKKPPHRRPWRCIAALVLALVVLPFPTLAELVENFPFVPVSAQRISRFEFEFVVRLQITNTGGEQHDVTCVASSSSPHTTILEGALDFGDIPAGATVLSSDTITFRQDRRFLFDTSAFSVA